MATDDHAEKTLAGLGEFAVIDLLVAGRDQPAAVAVGAGSIWVANAGDGTVSRIDPGARKVIETIDVGNAPAGLVVSDGLVWATIQAP